MKYQMEQSIKLKIGSKEEINIIEMWNTENKFP